MTSQGYRDWVKAGKPYALIRPATALVGVLRGYGLTVYHYPNEAHLQADLPQDHTPFSATGWPGRNARWNARGVDVMPRDAGAAAAKENADIARQLIRDRDAGVPGVMWIKYINWTDEQGTCRQERWTSSGDPLRRTTAPSGDDGHIHVSGRSDADNDSRADEYDPVARMTAGGSIVGTTLDSIHDPSWNEPPPVGHGDGDPRSLARLIWEGFDLLHTQHAERAAKFPNSISAAIVRLGVQIEAVLDAVEALPAPGSGGGQLPSEGGTLSDADVERIAVRTAELFAVKLGAGPQA